MWLEVPWFVAPSGWATAFAFCVASDACLIDRSVGGGGGGCDLRRTVLLRLCCRKLGVDVKFFTWSFPAFGFGIHDHPFIRRRRRRGQPRVRVRPLLLCGFSRDVRHVDHNPTASALQLRSLDSRRPGSAHLRNCARSSAYGKHRSPVRYLGSQLALADVGICFRHQGMRYRWICHVVGDSAAIFLSTSWRLFCSLESANRINARSRNGSHD